MMTMTTQVSWFDIVARLILTVIAGLALGYNRSEHGKAAGMRTMLLVCLAASVSMIQVNILLAMSGRSSDSFVMNDLMRFPLGILTGVGFIGGGAILRRGNLIVGVTTAATIWLGTVIGLCLGSGLLALGCIATALGLFALWVLKWAEDSLRQQQHAYLAVEVDASGLGEAEIRRRLAGAGLSITRYDVYFDAIQQQRRHSFEVSAFRTTADIGPPALINELALEPGVVKLEWKGAGELNA